MRDHGNGSIEISFYLPGRIISDLALICLAEDNQKDLIRLLTSARVYRMNLKRSMIYAKKKIPSYMVEDWLSLHIFSSYCSQT